MSRNIITISREFGSGGRTIGKEVAKKLGIAYYDGEIIEKMAEETGLEKEFIAKYGEHAPGKNVLSYAFLGRHTDGLSIQDYIWKEQIKLIRRLAQEGPCVIVGRCADYILRDRQDCLNVFIHADTPKKAERIVNLYGETAVKPEKRLEEKDKKRSANYKYYTGQTWGKAQHYHMTLDSGEIGIEKCVEIIADLAK